MLGDDLSGAVSDAPTSAGFTAIDVGSGSCAVDEFGAIACWGSDVDGLVSDRPTLGTFVDVVVGEHFGCALDDIGRVTCWGSDVDGVVSGTPTQQASQLAGSCCQVCMVTDSGSALCWGDVPALPPAGNSFTAVSVGTEHACALDSVGAISCWGNAAHYTDSAGIGFSGVGWSAVAVGAGHTCAVDIDGAVVCRGDDDHGQTSQGQSPEGPRSVYLDDFKSGDTVSCTLSPFDGLDFGLNQRLNLTF